MGNGLGNKCIKNKGRKNWTLQSKTRCSRFFPKIQNDYDEVFAPVVRQATLTLLLALAGKKNLTVIHFDAKIAFLNGNLYDVIYMQQSRMIQKRTTKFSLQTKKGTIRFETISKDIELNSTLNLKILKIKSYTL